MNRFEFLRADLLPGLSEVRWVPALQDLGQVIHYYKATVWTGTEEVKFLIQFLKCLYYALISTASIIILLKLLGLKKFVLKIVLEFSALFNLTGVRVEQWECKNRKNFSIGRVLKPVIVVRNQLVNKEWMTDRETVGTEIHHSRSSSRKK